MRKASSSLLQFDHVDCMYTILMIEYVQSRDACYSYYQALQINGINVVEWDGDTSQESILPNMKTFHQKCERSCEIVQ